MSSSSNHVPVNVLRGENLRAVAMPLGGIGTGAIALCGDGSLRQWQVCNSVNHLAHVPHSFFAVSARVDGRAAVARVLQSPALYDEEFEPIPCANDYAIPDECKLLLEQLPGVQATEFAGPYPAAEIRYIDEELPVEIRLTAYSPFCPLDSEDSGLPVIVFRFTAHNPNSHPASVHILATLQNFVGWDGKREIRGVECPLYGGNANHVLRLRGMTAIEMENALVPAGHPSSGTLCLAAMHDRAAVRTAWQDPRELWDDFARGDGLVDVKAPPTTIGRTVNGAVAIPLRLAPGETTTATFLYVWHFPNRYVDWAQGFSGIEDRKSLFWLGNAYASRFAGATAAAEYVRDNLVRLEDVTMRFRATFFDSTLPYELLDTVSSQLSIIRTPTCYRTEDGRFYAFEGCGGASTAGWNATGGCCPTNCSHVFAYEMSLSALYPNLERTMRETELFEQLHPTGYLPHRVTLPLYLPRPWERVIGGPANPALDGLLSMVLKTLREHHRCTDPDWLGRAWPKVKQAMHYVMSVHDADGDGVIKGEQPNTYDISFYGPNTFIGTLYLASLIATAEMAGIIGDPEFASECRDRFAAGSTGYDDSLWNGEYWIQIYDSEAHPEMNFGTGCHSDHLFGQWWAYVLGLGSLLAPERINTALRSIVRYNLRKNFEGHVQQPRKFASDDEAGLLVCSWPHGGRPEAPALYSDEIWTGLEYEVAALCIFCGMADEGLSILRAARGRYDGRRRSPWNDIECGDHYARAMSSWALLDAACGYQYDAGSAAFTVAPRLSAQDFRAFFITADAWGTVALAREDRTSTGSLKPAWGEMHLSELTIGGQPGSIASIRLDGEPVAFDQERGQNGIRALFPAQIRIAAGSELTVVISR